MSASTSPKVSIVIPTRNRHDVLLHCLRTVVNQDHENLEIIVSDNHSTPETRAVVESFQSPRLRYVNPGRSLSMSHNFEFALSHVAGDWIAVLGDDDGLLPGGIRKALASVLQSGLPCLCSVTGSYNWPTVLDGHVPVLEVPWRRGIEIRHSAPAVAAVMSGAEDYRSLPLLYTGGFVHASLLARMRPDGGPLIRSQIPDVYSAFALTSLTDRFVYSHEPFAVGGRSSHSTGLQVLLCFKGELAPFHASDLIPFHPDIPLPAAGTLTFSMAAMHYESYLQSAFLRSGAARVNAADQLVLILGKAPKAYRPYMDDWARRFALMHGLDLERALARESDEAGARRRQRLASSLAYALRFYRLFQPVDSALPTIFEACVTAQDLLDQRPRILRSHARFLAGIVQRKLARPAPVTAGVS